MLEYKMDEILDDLMSGENRERLIEIITRAKGDRSQGELAAELGVSSSAVQKWLSGAGFPSSDNLEKIAKAAGLSGLDALRAYLRGVEGDQKEHSKVAEEILPIVQQMDKEERKRLMKMMIDLE
jgi:transcriptional regulator with XRE-family HTH domain